MGFSQIVGLVVFVAACLSVGAIARAWTKESVKTWYPTLQKPTWTPPSKVIGPIWAVLYVFMGVAAWEVWRTGLFFDLPGIMFCLQLALTLGWCHLFFRRRRPDLAFADAIALWFSIFGTMTVFGQISTFAGLLFVPYLAWVTFATVLRAEVSRLNRHLIFNRERTNP